MDGLAESLANSGFHGQDGIPFDPSTYGIQPNSGRNSTSGPTAGTHADHCLDCAVNPLPLKDLFRDLPISVLEILQTEKELVVRGSNTHTLKRIYFYFRPSYTDVLTFVEREPRETYVVARRWCQPVWVSNWSQSKMQDRMLTELHYYDSTYARVTVPPKETGRDFDITKQQSGPSTPASPQLFLAFVQGVLKYKLINCTERNWYFQRDEEAVKEALRTVPSTPSVPTQAVASPRIVEPSRTPQTPGNPIPTPTPQPAPSAPALPRYPNLNETIRLLRDRLYRLLNFVEAGYSGNAQRNFDIEAARGTVKELLHFSKGTREAALIEKTFESLYTRLSQPQLEWGDVRLNKDYMLAELKAILSELDEFNNDLVRLQALETQREAGPSAPPARKPLSPTPI
jgi:hypothetical protein